MFHPRGDSLIARLSRHYSSSTIRADPGPFKWFRGQEKCFLIMTITMARMAGSSKGLEPALSCEGRIRSSSKL